MKRCTLRFISAFFALTALLATLPAQAQSAEFKPAVRQFPPAALRGEMVVLAPPGITMDGQAERLSPGSRIRDANNLLVMSGTLVNQTLAVNYLRESAGQVHEVWLLNSEEVRLKRPNSKSSWFSFGSRTNAETPATGKAP